MEKGDEVRIPLNSHYEVRVKYVTYKGRDYIDIRKYYLDDNDPQWSPEKAAKRSKDLFKPTKKGIALTPEQFKEVMRVLIAVFEGV